MNCDICYKRFTVTGDHIPLILPCGHSYCLNCLRLHFKLCTNNGTCPGCRTRCHTTRAESYSKNFKLLEILEAERKKSVQRSRRKGSGDEVQWQTFQEMTAKLCDRVDNLLEVFKSLDSTMTTTASSLSSSNNRNAIRRITEDLDSLHCLSLKVRRYQTEKLQRSIYGVTVKQRQQHRRQNPASGQVKQRWRY